MFIRTNLLSVKVQRKFQLKSIVKSSSLYYLFIIYVFEKFLNRNNSLQCTGKVGKRRNKKRTMIFISYIVLLYKQLTQN